MHAPTWTKNESKWSKIVIFEPFSFIGVSAELAEYSVPNIGPFFAEYSVFGRTLKSNPVF